MTQKYQVKVSMKQTAIVETGIVLKQGDFGMQIEIEVLDFDATGTTPQIVFRKAMGAVESTTITVSGNKYTYTFKGTELDTPGKCFCDLKLKNSTTQRISTASFMFKVVADTLDGLAEESSSYSDTIAQIVGGFDDEIEKITNEINTAFIADNIINASREYSPANLFCNFVTSLTAANEYQIEIENINQTGVTGRPYTYGNDNVPRYITDWKEMEDGIFASFTAIGDEKGYGFRLQTIPSDFSLDILLRETLNVGLPKENQDNIEKIFNSNINLSGISESTRKGFLRWDDGTLSPTSGYSCTNIIDVTPGSIIKLLNDDLTIFSLIFYNNNTFVSGKGNVTIDPLISVPDNVNQIGISFNTEYYGNVYIQGERAVINETKLSKITDAEYEIKSKTITKSNAAAFNNVSTNDIGQLQKIRIYIDDYVSTGATVSGRIYLIGSGNTPRYLMDQFNFTDGYSIELLNTYNDIVGFGIRIESALENLPNDFNLKLVAESLEYEESLYNIVSDMQDINTTLNTKINNTKTELNTRIDNFTNIIGTTIKPEVGYYRWDNGNRATTPGYSCTPILSVRPGSVLKLINEDVTIFSLVFYINNTFVSGKGNVTIDKTIYVPLNANQVSLSFTTEYNGYINIYGEGLNIINEHLYEMINANITNGVKHLTINNVLAFNNVYTDEIKEYRKIRFTLELTSTGVAVTGRIYLIGPGNTPKYLSDTVTFTDGYSIDFENYANDIVGWGIRIETALDSLPNDFDLNLTCIILEYIESLKQMRDDIDKAASRDINCFGDSITQAGNPTTPTNAYPAILQRLIGNKFIVHNYGVSGANTANITGRMCAIPMFLNQDIVFASGATTYSTTDQNVFKSSYPSMDNPRSAALINYAGYPNLNPCYIDGHKCNITISNESVLTITLIDGSSGITLHEGSKLYFNGGVDARTGLVNIVMMGTNGTYTDAADYKAQYEKVAKYCGKGNYLFLSQFDVHFTSDGTYTAYKTAQLNKLDNLKANEKAMEEAFGNHYINMRDELVKHGLEYAIEGGFLQSSVLTNANNLDAIGNEIVPFGDDFDGTTVSNYHNGLLYNVHPNDAGNYALAKIVYKHLVALGYCE